MPTDTAPIRGRGPYYGWCIVAICILTQVATNALAMNTFSLFLQHWSSEMHTPISAFLLSLSACGTVFALLAPITGTLADRYPARLLFGAGLTLLTLVFLGLSAASRPWQIIAIYALPLPLVMNLTTDVVCNSVLSRWFVRRLGLALGLSAFGLGLGGVILPPVLATLMPQFGWRAILHGGALIVALVVLPIAVIFTRNRPGARDGLRYLTVDGETGARAAGNGAAPAEHGLHWRDILSRRSFWLLVGAYLPMLALYSACMQNIAPIVASRGMGEQTAGLLMSAISIAQLLSALGGGALCDRFGARLPLTGMGSACAVGGALVAVGHSFPVLLAGVMLTAFGGSVWPVLTAALAGEFGSGRVGRALGLASFFMPLTVLVPFFVARLQETTGSYVPGLTALVAVTLLGAVASLLLPKRPRISGARTEPAVVKPQEAMP
jgi:MFS family permease